MRFQEVQEEQIVGPGAPGVGEVGVGHGHLARSLFVIVDARPVPREVEEVARSGDAAQVFGLEVLFKPGQGQRADAADVYPRVEHGQHVRLDAVPGWARQSQTRQASWNHCTTINRASVRHGRVCGPASGAPCRGGVGEASQAQPILSEPTPTGRFRVRDRMESNS